MLVNAVYTMGGYEDIEPNGIAAQDTKAVYVYARILAFGTLFQVYIDEIFHTRGQL